MLRFPYSKRVKVSSGLQANFSYFKMQLHTPSSLLSQIKASFPASMEYRKSSIKPPGGGLFFKSTFEGGGLFNLAKRITCSKNTVI